MAERKPSRSQDGGPRRSGCAESLWVRTTLCVLLCGVGEPEPETLAEKVVCLSRIAALGNRNCDYWKVVVRVDSGPSGESLLYRRPYCTRWWVCFGVSEVCTGKNPFFKGNSATTPNLTCVE